MTTEKQIKANRENAKKSTGPKTEKGKAIVRYNALKHGLLSKEVLLEGEDEKSLMGLRRKLYRELKPISELELMLVDRIVANIWRLRRVLEVERNTMEWEKETEFENTYNFAFDESTDEKRREVSTRKSIRKMIVNESIEKLLRYETSIERGIYRALHELQRIQSARKGEKPPAPLAVDVDVSTDK